MDVTIHYSSGGVMTIHLEELERSVGKRKKDYYNGGYYTPVTVSQCRKLLRMLLLHGEREDLERADAWMADCRNEKVRRIWDAECDRIGIKA